VHKTKAYGGPISVLPLFLSVLPLFTATALAQEDEGEDFSGGDTEAGDEPPISVNGYFKAQSGVFVPLISDGFKPQKNRLYGSIVDWKGNRTPNYEDVCDPVKENSQACVPLNHGIKPGTLSMGRSVFLLDGE